MNFINEVMTQNISNIQLIANSLSSPSLSKTTDTQKETNLRVKKSKIREICISDAISFNMLNICTNLTMKAGYKYVGQMDEFDELFKNMQSYGNNSSLRRLKKELTRDRFEYGAAFLEFIPYSDGKGIADLKRINASRIDYVRDSKKNIILNREGIPFGFVMDFGASAKLNSKGDIVPKQLEALGTFTLKKGQIYLKSERIAVFPLYRLENSFDYLGLIEPAYQDIVDRLEASQIQVNALKVKATSKPIISVGDSTHEPTPQMMNDANFILSNMEDSDGIAMPKFMELSTLEFKSLDIVNQTIKMLLSSSAAASGTPLALITGSGEATNRSTLHDQIQMTISMLQSQVNDFVEDWNILVLDRIKKENNFKGEATLVWEGIRYEDREEELKYAHEAFKEGGLSSNVYLSILKDKFNWDIDINEHKKKFGDYIKVTQWTRFYKDNGDAVSPAEKIKDGENKIKLKIESNKEKELKKKELNEESLKKKELNEESLKKKELNEKNSKINNKINTKE